MRTTLDLEADILFAAKELAALERKTAGQVISELARAGLRKRRSPGTSALATTRNGVPLLAGENRGVVSSGIVNRLRDEELHTDN